MPHPEATLTSARYELPLTRDMFPEGRVPPWQPVTQVDVKIGCTCPPKLTAVAEHEAHAPPEHVWPLAQAWPQVPQLAGSVAVITHAPPQRVAPAGQLEVQRPLAQVWPDGHAVPHAPQLAVSVAVSTQ